MIVGGISALEKKKLSLRKGQGMKTTKQQHKNYHMEHKEGGFEYPQWIILRR